MAAEHADQHGMHPRQQARLGPARRAAAQGRAAGLGFRGGQAAPRRALWRRNGAQSRVATLHDQRPSGGDRYGTVGIGHALLEPPPSSAAGAGKAVRGRMKPARPDRATEEGRTNNARSMLGLVARVVAGTAGLAVLAGLIALAIAAMFGWRPS